MNKIFKLGLAFIKNNKLLLCKSYAFDDYILPGGIRENNESSIECLKREVKEELGQNASLDITSLKYFGTFEDIAAGTKDTRVLIELSIGNVNGKIEASSEIKELVWFSLGYNDINLLSPIIKNKILPALIKAGLLK